MGAVDVAAPAMNKCALILLTVVAGACAQCDPLPNGDSCDGQENQRFADPEDCSSYYVCEAGCAKKMKCERDFLFDTLHEYCTYPLGVDCGGRPCEDPVHCITTTAPPSTTPDCGHVIDCADLGNEGEEGYYADPYNCRKYWHCYAGRSEHVMCDGDLVFDVFNIWCDYPDRVDCGDRPICDECDNNCYTMSPKPPTTPDCGHLLDCTDLADGWYADPYNCKKYWHCVKGAGVHYMCDDDLYYNEDKIQCDYADRVDCGDRPDCDACDENCVTPTTPPPDCGHIMDCSNKPDGWYADPYNCRKYWHCDHGEGQHHMCEKNYLYDPVHVWCDYPERVNCGSRPVCDECDRNCS